MGSRRHVAAPHGRSVEAPGMVLHEQLPAGIRHGDPLAAEIEHLEGDNHRLAATYVALKQDLSAGHREVEKLKEHIRSIQTESDIQVRLWVDKMSKMEVELRAGESMKKDVQEAHLDARSLVTGNMELTAKIHKTMQELEKARADVKKLPEMLSELDNLRKEHQNLRKSFEYEKGINIEKVEQLKLMEEELIGMAKEVERLRAEVANAEKRAQGLDPYGQPLMNSDPIYPASTLHHIDSSYQRPHTPVGDGEGTYLYGSSVAPAPPTSATAWGGSSQART